MPTPQERLIFDSLKDVLSQAVRGAPFDDLLSGLLQAAHALTGPDTQAAIYVADDAGALLHLGAAAGLAPSFMEALRTVPVDPQQAACGRAAALRTIVVVEDVLTEPRMAPYLDLARDHGVRACWSFPLRAPDGHVLGTLAFYHGSPRTPGPELCADLDYFADTAALVIDRHLREQRNARVQAESDRRRRLYEAVLGTTPDLVYVFDLDHRFTYANAVLLQMWDRTWDEAIGKNCLELGYPDWHAAMHDREIEQVKATRQRIRGVVPFDGAFGLRYYDYIFTPVIGPDGEVEAIAGTTRDVTEIKQAEEALLASRQDALAAARAAEAERQRLDAFLQAVPVGIVYCNADGKVELVNTATREMWGRRTDGERDAARGWWADGSARDGQPIAADEWAMARALAGEEVDGDLVEIESFGPDAARRRLLLRATAVRDGAGTITGAVVAQTDISERVRVEAALRESERRFRTITNAMPQMVWTAQPDGSIDYHNAQFYRFAGLAEGEADGRDWAERALHPDDSGAARAAWDHSVATGAPYEMTYRLRHASGDYRWILARALPLRDDDGAIVQWLGTDTDIHANKLAEDALQAANRRKDDFLAMLAHELRNPLAPISAASQVLRIAPADPAKVRNYAELIGRQVNHMTALVNDLLDVSRVTRGMVQFDKTLVDLRSVVASAAEQVHPLVEASRHALTIDVGGGPVPVLVWGDRARLIQVVANLLGNAAKYTPPGGRIALEMAVGRDSATIRVCDDGSGIEPALLPHIFELFTQGKRTPDRSQGGLGLGLALARTIVAAHDGSIAADSAGPGHGSCFTVTLPLSQQRQPEAALPAGTLAPAPNALNIMLVDDNADAAATLAALLDAGGHRVSAVADPAQAAAAALADPPDVFILDIGMPGMDGHELARRLRGERPLRDALYIALTGYGQPRDRELSRQAGFDHHLVKPVDADELLGLLRQRAAAPPRSAAVDDPGNASAGEAEFRFPA
nr:PAS domain S-box protein [uncultured Massilia sp.]